jgi:integrase
LTPEERARFERFKRFEDWDRRHGSASDRSILSMWDEWFDLLPEGSTKKSRACWRHWLTKKFRHGGREVTLGDLTSDECTSSALLSWLAMIGRTPGPGGKVLAAGSIDQIRRGVQSMFSHFVREGVAARNPLLKGQGVPHTPGWDHQREGFMPYEDMIRIAEHMPPIGSALLRHTWSTGCRIGNMLKLSKRQLDPALCDLKLVVKGTRQHRAAVPPKDMEEMQRLVAGNFVSDLIYPNPRDPEGGPIPPDTFRKWIRKACKRAGLPYMFPHLARHGRALHLLDVSGDITVVQDQLGHKSLTPTLRYLRARGARRNRVHDAVDKPPGDKPAR